jgi:hypothetical protein
MKLCQIGPRCERQENSTVLVFFFWVANKYTCTIVFASMSRVMDGPETLQ